MSSSIKSICFLLALSSALHASSPSRAKRHISEPLTAGSSKVTYWADEDQVVKIIGVTGTKTAPIVYDTAIASVVMLGQKQPALLDFHLLIRKDLIVDETVMVMTLFKDANTIQVYEQTFDIRHLCPEEEGESSYICRKNLASPKILKGFELPNEWRAEFKGEVRFLTMQLKTTNEVDIFTVNFPAFLV